MSRPKSNKILIVDDDEDILLLLKYNLEKAGFTIKTTSNSSTIINLAKIYNPDLIILDVMMPEINGLDLCKQLRTIKKFKKTYIFFLSARSDNQLKEQAFKNGANDYIDKMNGIKGLKTKISCLLN